MKKLEVINLSAGIPGKMILHDVNLTVRPGEVHVIMGPNGSGKSTLASALAGHPELKVSGRIILDGRNLTRLSSYRRAQKGLFLAFQQPVAIPGVSVVTLLREAFREAQKPPETNKTAKLPNSVFRGLTPGLSALVKEIRLRAGKLSFNEELLSRGINDGFSGGEKKKLEMLQALVLKPAYAIFDEIDTGLDVDSLKIVAAAISGLAKSGTGIIVITHYQRLTKYLPAGRVHILVSGSLLATGGRELINQVEKNGFGSFR